MEICDINSGKDETLCEGMYFVTFVSLCLLVLLLLLSTPKPINQNMEKFCEVNSGKDETLCEGMYFVTCVSHCEKPKPC